jgi:hypothetical protein
MKYIQPAVGEKSFTCPHCDTVSMQSWWSRKWDGSSSVNKNIAPLWIGTCHNCKESTVWVDENLFYPDKGNAPFPNPDMPESVIKLYKEASSIHNKSPRGAAALLRLGLQILCKELGEEGKNINADIGKLVQRGLPPMVQKALDSVRVIGNDAVHPGQIDTDDPETVGKLFKLTNLIVEYMITLPKEVDDVYNGLPEEKLKGIEGRDKKKDE